MQKYYYGVFQTDDNGIVTVSIPDVEICETFGDTWEEAYENAVDALAGCLSVPETITHPRTPKADLEKQHPGAQIIPVPLDEKILRGYEETRRFNVTFPASLLQAVDEFRAGAGLKRSTLLQEAAKEYIESHTE
jgi:predicted RNase H-like HicB family nuclease